MLNQLKLEIAALLLNNPPLNEKDLKRELFLTFKHHYDEILIKQALEELKELNDQVQLSKEEENVIVYADQFYSGI